MKTPDRISGRVWTQGSTQRVEMVNAKQVEKIDRENRLFRGGLMIVGALLLVGLSIHYDLPQLAGQAISGVEDLLGQAIELMKFDVSRFYLGNPVHTQGIRDNLIPTITSDNSGIYSWIQDLLNMDTINRAADAIFK